MVDVDPEAFEPNGHFGHPQVEGTFSSTYSKGPKPPFGHVESVSVDTESDVNLAQLSDEIGVLNGAPVQCAMVSLDTGARLYITPPVSEELIARAIAAHEPDELYSLTPEQRARHELAEKIKSGTEINNADLLRALGMTIGSE